MSSPSPERQFPPNCPGCGRLSAEVAQSHCKERKVTCAWLTCKIPACATTYDQRGNFYPRKPAGAGS